MINKLLYILTVKYFSSIKVTDYCYRELWMQHTIMVSERNQTEENIWQVISLTRNYRKGKSNPTNGNQQISSCARNGGGNYVQKGRNELWLFAFGVKTMLMEWMLKWVLLMTVTWMHLFIKAYQTRCINKCIHVLF